MALYLTAKFHVHPHKTQEFGPIGRRVCDIIVKRAGWRLLAALSPVTGRLNECVHLWQIPDANALAALPGLLKPEDYEAAGQFAECVSGEDYQILSALEYHPQLG
ncbi:MAG TPA: hypothetical protein VK524_07205 [Polyangiaceae bacterium]|nr:hypothetical protein [Polyangiaceae bacterium]